MTEPDTILIVEDEPELADLFALWLADEFTCRVAYDGESALEQADADVDAVLLDRRMPGMSGDEVLEKLRERGIDCPVGMVTAVEPDFDIVEMGFDDYIVKPVAETDLLEFVDSILSLSTYEREIRRYYQLASKRAVLETSKEAPELQQSAEYEALLSELNEAEHAADQHRDAISDEEMFSNIF